MALTPFGFELVHIKGRQCIKVAHIIFLFKLQKLYWWCYSDIAMKDLQLRLSHIHFWGEKHDGAIATHLEFIFNMYTKIYHKLFKINVKYVEIKHWLKKHKCETR